MTELRFSACPFRDTSECGLGMTLAIDRDMFVPFCSWGPDCNAPVLRSDPEVVQQFEDPQINPHQFLEERGGF